MWGSLPSLYCSILWEALMFLVCWKYLHFTYRKQAGVILHPVCVHSWPSLNPLSNLQLRNYIVESSVFICKCTHFYLCKCRHLWIEICWSETRVAPSLWTVALKLFCLMTWALGFEAKRILVCISWCSGVAIMIAIKAITRGPGATGLLV